MTKAWLVVLALAVAPACRNSNAADLPNGLPVPMRLPGIGSPRAVEREAAPAAEEVEAVESDKRRPDPTGEVYMHVDYEGGGEAYTTTDSQIGGIIGPNAVMIAAKFPLATPDDRAIFQYIAKPDDSAMLTFHTGLSVDEAGAFYERELASKDFKIGHRLSVHDKGMQMLQFEGTKPGFRALLTITVDEGKTSLLIQYDVRKK